MEPTLARRELRRRSRFVAFDAVIALLLMMASTSGPCGKREAISSRGRECGNPVGRPAGQVRPGVLWKDCGQAKLGAPNPGREPVREAQSIGFPQERAQSAGFSCLNTTSTLQVGTRISLIFHILDKAPNNPSRVDSWRKYGIPVKELPSRGIF